MRGSIDCEGREVLEVAVPEEDGGELEGGDEGTTSVDIETVSRLLQFAR